MNCSVSAGPATVLPLVQAVGPQMCALRMPMWNSVLLAVAAPICLIFSTRCAGGRVMSSVVVMLLRPLSFA